jgi:ubiquinone/menaquinone biosynthesis C-methylase UbiE
MIARFQARQLANPDSLFSRILAPLWNRRNAALNDAAYRLLEPVPGDRILDIGFGGGYLLARVSAMPGIELAAGVDHSAALVERARARFGGRVTLKCAPAEALPFPDGTFNKVVSVNSIFYWEDAPRALQEIYRALAPGGRLALVFTERESLQEKEFSHYGVQAYTGEEVSALLQAAGFTDIRFNLQADRHRRFVCLTAAKAVPRG